MTHIYKFNLIRSIAVLSVVFGHYFCHYSNYEASQQWFAYFKIHHIAMGLFFSLSGCLIYQSMIKSQNIFVFFKRRILRLMPSIFALCFALAMVIRGGYKTIFKFIEAITLTGDIFNHRGLFGIDFWSLHTEFRFYCLIAFVYFVLKLKNIQLLLASLTIWFIVLSIMYFGGSKIVFAMPIWNFLCIVYIFFGILIYLKQQNELTTIKFILYALLLVILSSCVHYWLFKNIPFAFFIGIIITYAIISIKNIKYNAMLNHIAEISYPLYLTHHFCIAKLGFVGIFVAFILSEILHFFVEKPFIEYAKTSKLKFF